MNKKSMLVFMIFSLISMISGCQSFGVQSVNKIVSLEQDKESTEKIKLKIFNGKVEISELLLNLKHEYEKSHPKVELEFESIGGGGANYPVELNTRNSLGETPDIFMLGGRNDFETWKDVLEDLSGESWASQLVSGTADNVSEDQKIYGMPMNIEGYGFLYNKSLFEKAGITEVPDTLAKLEEACKKLQSIGVIPFSNGYKVSWVLGRHNFNVPLARQQNPSQFIQDLKDGKQTIPQNEIFKQWVDLLDLTLKYGNQDALSTDYDKQIQLFAEEKAAMMQQGNWTQLAIKDANPNLNVGILPMPINNEPVNKIFVGVPSYWAIYKDSLHKQQAKEFLNWMVSSDVGKKYLVKEFKFIPAFSNIPYDSETLGSIAGSMQEYIAAENVLGWHWSELPSSVPDKIYEIMQLYIARKISKEQLLEQMQAKIMKQIEEE